LNLKEMTMNALNALYRDATCGAGAIVITLVLAMSFLQSTALRPGTEVSTLPTVSLQIPNGWFGQPQPAVLVD
jgi:hypothetical protein